ncbi:hypothetical protein QZH41_004394 [Actinostola sp. cb2023]|nr:hypothetical protein QZH41_004394 [Actinostola sp. cb2023]
MSDEEFDEESFVAYENELYEEQLKDSDDEIESDVEEALYGQVHYSFSLSIEEEVDDEQDGVKASPAVVVISDDDDDNGVDNKADDKSQDCLIDVDANDGDDPNTPEESHGEKSLLVSCVAYLDISDIDVLIHYVLIALNLAIVHINVNNGSAHVAPISVVDASRMVTIVTDVLIFGDSTIEPSWLVSLQYQTERRSSRDLLIVAIVQRKDIMDTKRKKHKKNQPSARKKKNAENTTRNDNNEDLVMRLNERHSELEGKTIIFIIIFTHDSFRRTVELRPDTDYYDHAGSQHRDSTTRTVEVLHGRTVTRHQASHTMTTDCFQAPLTKMTARHQGPHIKIIARYQEPHIKMTARHQEPHIKIIARYQEPHIKMTARHRGPHIKIIARYQAPKVDGVMTGGEEEEDDDDDGGGGGEEDDNGGNGDGGECMVMAMAMMMMMMMMMTMMMMVVVVVVVYIGEERRGEERRGEERRGEERRGEERRGEERRGEERRGEERRGEERRGEERRGEERRGEDDMSEKERRGEDDMSEKERRGEKKRASFAAKALLRIEDAVIALSGIRPSSIPMGTVQL